MTEMHLDPKGPDGFSADRLPDGYYRLPRGKLANAVTYLEMTVPPAAEARRSAPVDTRLERLTGKDATRFLGLYRAVGEPWLWAAHLAKSREQIAQVLDDPSCETVAAVNGQGDIGLLQLEYDEKGNAEIVYIGVIVGAIGNGIGRWLIEEAVARAFARPVRRLWLHTCNFDHPEALRFYQAAGFKIYATGFEIMHDPRVLGLLPKTAAPHVPMVT
jgi:ribosomal protein S18 acetylase RimI-like enzyme